MDSFGKQVSSDKLRKPVHNIPANRPSVVNVPPQEQQLTSIEITPPISESEETKEVSPSALRQLDLSVKEPHYARRRNWVKRIIITTIITVVVACIGMVGWYFMQLMPVDASKSDRVTVQVEMGASPDMIASKLKSQGLIRSELVFMLNARFTGVQGKLQAGTYRLSPSESTPAITGHLVKGITDTFDITFLPGATVKQNKDVMMKAGYSKQEVDEAFAATYDSPLFESKPKDADLEGYIYGDTYKFTMGVPAKKVLERIFTQFYATISERRLDRGFQKQGLTLFQAITLASIIQRESGGGDEAQISQIFQTRMKIGMPLGSDVTYQYIADKTGVERDVNLDSPYNTRRYTGLPPGPIATPGLAALRAVSLPAEGDYLYFLSGDDDVTYYGKTIEEHNANIKNHCQKKCQII